MKFQVISIDSGFFEDSPKLIKLAGGTLSSDRFSLGDWYCYINVDVTNQKGITREFVFEFRPEELENRNYSGYEVMNVEYTAGVNSILELEEFLNYEYSIPNDISKIVAREAQIAFDKALQEQKDCS